LRLLRRGSSIDSKKAPMPRRFDIAAIADRFPDFRVAVLAADRLAIPAERPRELDRIIVEHEALCRERWAGTELSAIPGIAAWRSAYRAFGIKRTSYRSSVERLVKNVLAGRPLPRVNGFVDAYNAVSLAHVLCLGADDLDRVEGNLAFRFSEPGDSFRDMAAEAGEDPYDPPKPGEVVYADEAKVLCRRWNWRQDARSVITADTRRAIVTVQSNGAGDLAAAVAELGALLERFCGAEVQVAFADPTHPAIEVPE
jgi:DNA/RNA-binding domain of Phe-tRNA-synthetase-like protein